MNIKDAVNRTNNLLATVIVGIAGLAFAPEILIEDKWRYKLDDWLLFLLGAGAFLWYRKGRNKFTRSLMPVILVAAGLVIKIIGITIEIKEKDDVGDDFGGLILFITATMVVLYLYKTTKHLLKDVKQSSS